MRSIVSIFLVSLILFNIPMAHAGWVDDWFDQAVSSGPDTFEGQKRGYISGGSLMLRYPRTNDYLFTVTTPSFKGGCGGIDLFLGGFSYLNPEYLVDKFQRIISAAPAFAFQIAMDTISQQISKVMEGQTALIDRLNQLQFDDCKASKALVALPMALAGNEKYQHDITRFLQDSGVQDLWNEAKKQMETDPSGTLSTTKTQVTEGEPPLQNLLYQEGSLLEKIGNEFGISTEWIDTMRGYVGDIVVKQDNDPTKFDKIPPCAEAKTDRPYEDFVDGRAKRRVKTAPGSYTCQDLADLNNNIRAYVSNMMAILETKTATNTGYGQAEKDFLKRSPVPALINLRLYLVDKLSRSQLNALDAELAYVYAIGLTRDLFDELLKYLDEYEILIHNTKAENSFKANALDTIKEFKNNVRKQLPGFETAFRDHLEEYLKLVDNFVGKKRIFTQALRTTLGKEFVR